MVWLPGGNFMMGSNRDYPEEGPARRATVAGFWIDTHELTNGEFARFVAATNYRTVAERPPRPVDGAPPEMLRPGSAVFAAPQSPEDPWWRWVPGAQWRHPEGPASSIVGRDNEPVVQIAYEDALAYARWAGKSLPTETQWEYAARGGLNGRTYAWGDELDPGGVAQANYYQGVFPVRDTGSDGFAGRAPVGCFRPNGYGLYDMIGNVWELTASEAGPQPGMHVIRGGSYLCAPNYCHRYRPSARQFQEGDLGTDHVGVRFVRNVPGPSSPTGANHAANARTQPRGSSHAIE